MNQTFLKIGTELLAIWKQLGVNQRISIVLATALVLGGLTGLGLWSSRGEYALLYGNLEEGDSAKITRVLDESSVPFRVTSNGKSILVPAKQVHRMRMELASKGIPRGGHIGFEILDRPNFGISDFVQRANYVRAVQGELARTITQMDEVEAARVMIVIPENKLLNDSSVKPTASVFVRVGGLGRLHDSAVNSIRFLVSNAVEGLQPGHVSVVDNLGNVLSKNESEDSLSGLTSYQLETQQNLEDYLSQKAETLLQKVLGPGQAVVRVAAEIDWSSQTTVEEIYDPTSQVELTATTTEDTSDTFTAQDSAPGPGMDSNTTSPTNSIAAVPTSKSNTKKKVETTEYGVSKTTSNLIQNAGGIKQLSAAVFINARYSGSGTNRVQVPRAPQEITQLTEMVQKAIGISNTTDITLQEIEFNLQPMVDFGNQITQQETRRMWLELGRHVLYPALALIFIIAFWRAFKKTPAHDIPIGIPLGQFEEYSDGNSLPSMGREHVLAGNGNGNGSSPGNGGEGGGVPKDTIRSWQRNARRGVVTVDVLNQLIRENPDNMTQAVRSWLMRSNSEKK